jgi:ferredoxin
MLSTMRSAGKFCGKTAREVMRGGQVRQARRGFALQNVRHAEAAAAGGAAAKEITLNLRIGQDVLPIRAQVGKTLLDAAHLNEVNVDGTCDGDLACSTCHVVIADKEVYGKADALSKGSEEGLYKRELEDDLLLRCALPVLRPAEMPAASDTRASAQLVRRDVGRKPPRMPGGCH